MGKRQLHKLSEQKCKTLKECGLHGGGRRTHADFDSDLLVFEAISSRQHDPCPLRERLRVSAVNSRFSASSSTIATVRPLAIPRLPHAKMPRM
jgi:hypothetical protein